MRTYQRGQEELRIISALVGVLILRLNLLHNLMHNKSPIELPMLIVAPIEMEIGEERSLLQWIAGD
jgi:hypothetical protein